MFKKYLTLLLLITVCQVLAQPNDPIFSFIENKGQWPENVLFMLSPNGQTTLFIEKDRITITHKETIPHDHPHGLQEVEMSGHSDNDACNHETLKNHTYSIVFTNGYAHTYSTSTPSTDYLNFFEGNKQISKVYRFSEVTLNNIWEGISLHIGQANGAIKFDWYLEPNSNLESLKLEYIGVDDLRLANGALEVVTSLGTSLEKQPFAWIDESKEEIEVEYELSKNTLQYKTNWDRSGRLIIDPELVFSTYSGSYADNWGYTAAGDNDGNVFSGGIVGGTGYPVTIGAWQSGFGGNWDIGIIKYNPSGTQRLWASYLGGNQADMPHSMVCDQDGNLIIMGTTGSNNYPVTSGAYSQTFKGGKDLTYGSVIKFPSGSDIIISKLSADGTQLIGSTFLGGTGNDGLNYQKRYEPFRIYGNDSLYLSYGDGVRGEVGIDENQNIYIASSTFSANFPTTSGVAQPNYRGGQEGVICKLSPNLSSLLWSTFWGGSKDDALFSIDADDNFIIAAGGTLSSNITTTPNAVKPTFQGGTGDGMVVRINKNTGALLNATYFGTPSLDLTYFTRTDQTGDVYLFGLTKNNNNLLYAGGVYTNPGSGQFIAKLSPELDTIYWCGLFGSGRSGPEISPTAFEIDRCNRIMLSGWSRYWGGSIYQGTTFNWYGNWGTTGFPITPDAIQPTTDGQDFYISVFETNFSDLLYATFYGELHSPTSTGQDHVDGGTSRFDSNGNIIQSVCASCGGSNSFPTFPNPGAWSNNNNSSNCNNAVFKINLNIESVSSQITASGTGCYPDTVHFQASNSPVTYNWDFGDPSSGLLNHSSEASPQHIYTSGGTYTVTLIAGWPGNCNAVDTVVSSLTIISDSNYYINNVSLCWGDSIQIGIPPSADTTIQYKWVPTIGLSDSTISNPISSPPTTTLYLLTISYGNNCTDSLHQWLIVEPHYLTVPHNLVSCDTIAGLSAIAPPGSSFQWSSNAQFSDTLNSPLNNPGFIATGWGLKTFYIRATNSGGCQLTDSTTVNFAFDTINIIGATRICSMDSARYILTHLSDSCQMISWSPPQLITQGQGTDTISLRSENSFQLKVEMLNAAGCPFKDSLLIEVKKPLISILTHEPLCYADCTGWISASFTNGYPPYSIQWSTGDTTNAIDSLCQGTYQLFVIDELGCKDTAGTTLNSPAPLNLRILLKEPNCNTSADGSITIIPDGGTKPYKLRWLGGIATGDTMSINNLKKGIYNLTIEDKNGCTIDTLLLLKSPPPLHIQAITSDVSCKGDSNGEIKITVMGGTLPYQFNWSNGATASNIQNLSAGLYNVSIADSNLCDTILSFNIKEPLLPLTYSKNIKHTRCYEGSDGAIIITPAGGTSPYIMNWSTGQVGLTLAGLKKGVITGLLYDSLGCSTSIVDTIKSPSKIEVNINTQNPSCPENTPDGQIKLTIGGGTAPYQINWENGQVGNLCSGLLPGVYWVVITDQNNCIIDTSAQLQPPPGPLLQTKTTDPTCFGGKDGRIQLFISGGTSPFTVIWNNGQTGVEIGSLSQGHYVGTITDGMGCKDTLTLKLQEPPAISVQKIVTDAICPNTLTGSIELIAEGGIAPLSVVWKDNSMEFIRHNLKDGIYQYTINDLNFCSITDTVKVNYGECEIVIPNVITPNGDNINDDFIITNIEYQYENRLVIYNRWGNEIREYKPYLNQWDGTDSNGNAVPEGTYYYILWLNDGRHFQGSVNVER
jgi:gliding motility-associated-like protein